MKPSIVIFGLIVVISVFVLSSMICSIKEATTSSSSAFLKKQKTVVMTTHNPSSSDLEDNDNGDIVLSLSRSNHSAMMVGQTVVPRRQQQQQQNHHLPPRPPEGHVMLLSSVRHPELLGGGAESVEGGFTGTYNAQQSRPPLVRTRKQSARPCRGTTHTRGRWVYNPNITSPRYPAYGDILGACGRYQTFAERKELQYEWKPDKCELLAWDEETFCKALDGRDIMFAGDSMQDHWHASLFYLLGGRGDIYRREGTIAGKRACQTHRVCHKYYDKPLRIFHLTNQFLTLFHLRNRNHPWFRWVHKYPILILNSGSWMRDPADEKVVVPDTKWIQMMEAAARFIRDHYNGTVIWRTTFSGHPYCWKNTEPLMEEITTFPNVHPYDKYRWGVIPLRNGVTTNLFKSIGAHILDISRPTNLMPMGHLGQFHPKFKEKNATDCLHYCSPGIYDTWSTLLMNLLTGNIEYT
eukprot:PhM_4_TR11180/c0_g1_i1/m.13797